MLTTGHHLWHRVGRRSELTKTTLEFSCSEVVVIGRADMEAVSKVAVDSGFIITGVQYPLATVKNIRKKDIYLSTELKERKAQKIEV